MRFGWPIPTNFGEFESRLINIECLRIMYYFCFVQDDYRLHLLFTFKTFKLETILLLTETHRSRSCLQLESSHMGLSLLLLFRWCLWELILKSCIAMHSDCKLKIVKANKYDFWLKKCYRILPFYGGCFDFVLFYGEPW
jgi:hypothetical protein